MIPFLLQFRRDASRENRISGKMKMNCLHMFMILEQRRGPLISRRYNLIRSFVYFVSSLMAVLLRGRLRTPFIRLRNVAAPSRFLR
ncbi:hypothetical protein D3C77_583470 [compost metagenome]